MLKGVAAQPPPDQQLSSAYTTSDPLRSKDLDDQTLKSPEPIQTVLAGPRHLDCLSQFEDIRVQSPGPPELADQLVVLASCCDLSG